MRTLKTTLVLFLAMLTVLGTAACGGSSGNNTSNQKATVTYMTWETNATNALLDSAMKKFMQQNPNITVQRIPTPSTDYTQKLTSLQVAKKLPDLFWAGNDTEQQYGQEGLLYDYTNDATSTKTSTFSLAQYAPASVENWKYNGHLYGLPSLMNTYGVWYNADLFQAAGLPLPKAGWTYQEMLHDAQVLTQKNGNSVTRYGLWLPPDDPFSLGDYSVSAGGAPFTNKIMNPTKVTASSQFVQGTKLYVDAIQNGYVTPPNYPSDNATDGFVAGKIPMLYFGQWLAPSFLQAKPNFSYGFAPLPVVNSVVQPYDAVGISSPSYIQNHDAVWKVMQFLDTGAWETVLPGSPVAPTAYLPSATPYFNTLKSANLSSVADSIQYELNSPTKESIRFVGPWATQATNVITADWNNILLGKTPADSGIQQMVQQLNSTIQQGS